MVKPKTKKSTRKKWVKKLDKIVSEIVREIYGECITCGSTEKLGCGHLFSRVAYSTRWDVAPGDNCYCQCWSCNFRHEYDPYPFTKYYLKRFGEGKYDELHRRYKTPKKYTTSDLEDLYNELILYKENL